MALCARMIEGCCRGLELDLMSLITAVVLPSDAIQLKTRVGNGKQRQRQCRERRGTKERSSGGPYRWGERDELCGGSRIVQRRHKLCKPQLTSCTAHASDPMPLITIFEIKRAQSTVADCRLLPTLRGRFGSM